MNECLDTAQGKTFIVYHFIHLLIYSIDVLNALELWASYLLSTVLSSPDKICEMSSSPREFLRITLSLNFPLSQERKLTQTLSSAGIVDHLLYVEHSARKQDYNDT